jgi:hypothetical protein
MSVTSWPRLIAYSTCSGPVKPVPPRMRIFSFFGARGIDSAAEATSASVPSAMALPAAAAETFRKVRRLVVI